MRALPVGAQIAPIFGMLARDYDGDGDLDALLVGNSYASETQAGWNDASIGGVLVGDGRGQFGFVNGAASGFFVDGDARSIADVMLDETRSLVLVTQHRDSLRVFAPSRSVSERKLRVEPLDAYVVLTRADGTTRRQELYYGSTYLSQSSRYVSVPAGVVKAVVFDSRGQSRTILGSATR